MNAFSLIQEAKAAKDELNLLRGWMVNIPAGSYLGDDCDMQITDTQSKLAALLSSIDECKNEAAERLAELRQEAKEIDREISYWTVAKATADSNNNIAEVNHTSNMSLKCLHSLNHVNGQVKALETLVLDIAKFQADFQPQPQQIDDLLEESTASDPDDDIPFGSEPRRKSFDEWLDQVLNARTPMLRQIAMDMTHTDEGDLKGTLYGVKHMNGWRVFDLFAELPEGNDEGYERFYEMLQTQTHANDGRLTHVKDWLLNALEGLRPFTPDPDDALFVAA